MVEERIGFLSWWLCIGREASSRVELNLCYMTQQLEGTRPNDAYERSSVLTQAERIAAIDRRVVVAECCWRCVARKCTWRKWRRGGVAKQLGAKLTRCCSSTVTDSHGPELHFAEKTAYISQLKAFRSTPYCLAAPQHNIVD